jgi:hypothetical protein
MKTQPAFRTKEEKRIYADQRACYWIAAANNATEKGDAKKAAEYERKAQFWLDRLNVLEGLSQ